MNRPHPTLPSSAPVWLPMLAMLAVLFLRVAGQHHWVSGWPNLSPLMALAFTGTLVFPKPLPWWSWALILLGVDAVSTGGSWWNSVGDRPQVLLAYGCYALAAFVAGRIRRDASVLEAIGGTFAFAVLFYLVTNTVSWWSEPAYAKTVAGWVQALTIGNPAFRPTTLEFFRNSLAADLLGSFVLVLLYNGEALVRQLAVLPWSARRQVVAAA